ncbi:cysteine proteinase [Durotheca rogersii]|uniref:cysteine proteinase n=1 Tax=Durotheca rogersii TaxID=419775 RepID=UPI00221E6FBE|nr:cysteine proteinase [Durotheca rogersii]KAI5867169.1 cysteine proteinase [Durotheca rogersii]
MSYDSEIHSLSDTMVDSQDEMVVQPASGERDQVAEINPDHLDNDTEQSKNVILATDFEAMKAIALPPLLDEPPILEDAVNTWTVENWRALSKKEHGPIFEAGGFPWRILLFPFGNNVDQSSIYLEHGFEDTSSIPEDWSCCVQFALVMWNINQPSLHFHHNAHHRFTKEESDWGFTRFLELRKMFQQPWDNSNRPLVENDAVNITAYVRVVKDETGVLWHNFNNYDSKKETGYVGLKNQGATCYLNSLLQSLFFTNAFRKAVYEIPTAEDESITNSAYTLQRLFYQLQISNSAVGTTELTKSFGWDTRHIFEQQDVQELSRKLIERMEERMKGTAAEDALPRMLSGKVKTYVSCIDVEYESSRIEDFWDIQLNVRGIHNLEESFKDYIQQETLDGDNKYWAGDEFKYQDARKGVIFKSFPEVLHLHLKRFEYDIQRDTMMKINDRFEYPEVLNLEPFLDNDADKSEPWIYKLHGVLVHSGDLNGGHYYAYLKPNKDGWFHKFDDDKVTKATMRETLEENFGGEYPASLVQARTGLQKKAPIMRQMSAYMLVYIRESRLDQVLTPVNKEDCPAHLQKRLDEEAAAREAKKREREEQHLYLPAKVITEESFRHHGGTDLTNFDANPAEDPAAPRFYRTKKQTSMEDLVAQIAHDINQSPKMVRLWIMVNRQNKTTRPDQPIMDLKPTIEETFSRTTTTSRDYALRVWAEVAEEVDAKGDAIWPTYQSNANGVVVKNDLILLFLKHFDAEKQTLEGVGHIYVSKEKRVEELVPIIAKKMGWGEKLPSGEQLAMWEEIKPAMIESLKAKQSLKAAELQDGDIICFQRVVDRKSGEILGKIPRLGDRSPEETPRRWDRYDDAKAFYDFLCNKREIRFDPHPRYEKANYQSFILTLSTKIFYDQLAERVGEQLGVEPTHLRFFTVNASTGTPKAPIKRAQAQNQNLGTLLNNAYSTQGTPTKPNSLFFEVLDMSLAELDTKKNVKVTWLSEGITKADSFDVLVPKQGHIEDLVQALTKKAQIQDEQEGGRIRVYEINHHKFFRDLAPNYPVVSLNDYADIIAERIPEEEADADDRDFIRVVHFQNDSSRVHGIPFKFLLKEGEPFSETKKRLEKRTGIKGKAFEKIKFAILRRYQKPAYIGDDDVLFDEGGSLEDDILLGLDHPDRTRATRNGGEMFLR